MVRGISVILCCYNSEKLIRNTLFYLSVQRFRINVSWEIILVNNCSTDKTVEVALEYWESINKPAKLKIVNESKLGLNNARVTGIYTSKYEFLIYCDDDNFLGRDYVQHSYDLLLKNSNVAAFGGINNIQKLGKLPRWFDKNKRKFAVGDQTSKRKLDSVWGAGMVFRKAVFLRLIELGVYVKSDDRKGESLTSGGDTEICLGFKLLGYSIKASNKLVLTHFITPNRLTRSYLIKLTYYLGKSSVYIYPYLYAMNNGNKLVRHRWIKEILHTYRNAFRCIINGRNSIQLVFYIGYVVALIQKSNWFDARIQELNAVRSLTNCIDEI